MGCKVRQASKEARISLQELRDVQRSHLLSLRRAEEANKRRKLKARKRAAFVANPFKFSKSLFNKEKSGKLQSSIEEIQQYLRDTHSDHQREEPLGHCPKLEAETPPNTTLDTKESTFPEVKEVVRKVRAGSAPGANGIHAISQQIREAKVTSDLTVVWLDLANAYGSLPHQLIEEAMKQYYIPELIQGIMDEYFNGIQLRFAVGNRITSWQKLEKGIVTGCTISVVLFVMRMNLIINAAKRETRGPKTAFGMFLSANRGFMDDLTVSTKTHVQARWVLSALDEAATWARIKFKAKKSRSMVIKNGQTTKKFNFQVQGEDIPSIVDSPIKCLGKWYDASLNDANNIQRIKNQLQEGLKQIDQTGLPGKFKAWLFQHGLLPRLMWPLMLYEIATSTVEGLENKRSADTCVDG
ncbi:uncharacterized protein LOC128555904 [Mercenaria mercenaria]|uniref:uncharacterized protein LOC128555904 n=1 Tax=Mercenaria mercenaria TaxID=6596 RepID=UPI00234EE588|nr:uncharacterized protein LOC128555904 [Mercenaria mercenaria]